MPTTNESGSESQKREYKRLRNLPELVQLNVGGQIVETYLETLTKIEGSLLADTFSGQAFTAVDVADRPIIDSRPDVFNDML